MKKKKRDYSMTKYTFFISDLAQDSLLKVATDFNIFSAESCSTVACYFGIETIYQKEFFTK